MTSLCVYSTQGLDRCGLISLFFVLFLLFSNELVLCWLMCFIHRRYRPQVPQCFVISRAQEHDGIGSIVTILYIVVCQTINYTFVTIPQSDNAMVSCVWYLSALTFSHGSKRFQETGSEELGLLKTSSFQSRLSNIILLVSRESSLPTVTS